LRNILARAAIRKINNSSDNPTTTMNVFVINAS
jgi:hypothetical protein